MQEHRGLTRLDCAELDAEESPRPPSGAAAMPAHSHPRVSLYTRRSRSLSEAAAARVSVGPHGAAPGQRRTCSAWGLRGWRRRRATRRPRRRRCRARCRRPRRSARAPQQHASRSPTRTCPSRAHANTRTHTRRRTPQESARRARHVDGGHERRLGAVRAASAGQTHAAASEPDPAPATSRASPIIDVRTQEAVLCQGLQLVCTTRPPSPCVRPKPDPSSAIPQGRHLLAAACACHLGYRLGA